MPCLQLVQFIFVTLLCGSANILVKISQSLFSSTRLQWRKHTHTQKVRHGMPNYLCVKGYRLYTKLLNTLTKIVPQRRKSSDVACILSTLFKDKMLSNTTQIWDVRSLHALSTIQGNYTITSHLTVYRSYNLWSHWSKLGSIKTHNSTLGTIWHTRQIPPQYSLALEEILQAQQSLLPLWPVGAGAVVQDLCHVLRLAQVMGDASVPWAVRALRAGTGSIAVGVVIGVHPWWLVPPPQRLPLWEKEEREGNIRHSVVPKR